MNRLSSNAIILKRINYGESDRIITLITPGFGKLRLMAKGVRKSTSKLAGGIELFSESNIMFIKGKGDIGTLVSTRLNYYCRHIVSNYELTQIGYEFINVINKVTEENCDESYYQLLMAAFLFLDASNDDGICTIVWFYLRLLTITGHALELDLDIDNNKLVPGNNYDFNFQIGRFHKANYGYDSNQIKALRLLMKHNPNKLTHITGLTETLKGVILLLRNVSDYYLHIRGDYK